MDDLNLRAREYAMDKHSGQTRKGKQVPYFDHVAQVARTLDNYGFREEVVAAGYLRDVTEDVREVTISDISNEFGEEVARLVEGFSENDKSLPWMERKKNTIEHLEEAPLDEVAVKVADKIDNVRSMRQELSSYQNEDEFWSKFNQGFDNQEWYHNEIDATIDERLKENYELHGSLGSMYRELRQEVKAVFG